MNEWDQNHGCKKQSGRAYLLGKTALVIVL
jgi:hypothetical protein